ncbi:ParA family protein [Paraburkholderia sp. B3]|uniref:ParA family protein n=1 Tax=Paraburkholderia sp. B3 TaxID=3134791 RepID=UPI003981F57D
MKSLLIVSARHRSGSTTLTCLLASYLQSVARRRVLVLDLAEPPWCARVLACGSGGTAVTASRLPDVDYLASTPRGAIRVLDACGVDGLRAGGDSSPTPYYANLRHLLSVAGPWFDVCLIDAPVLPDVRTVCAEALVDAAVSPMAVSPSYIDCALEVINGTYGIRNVRARLNPALRFTGLLPVMATPGSANDAWVRVIETTLREWLIEDEALPQGYALLPRVPYVDCVEDVGSSSKSSRGVAARDATVSDASRAVTACLKVITQRLDAVPTASAAASGHAGACNV